LVKGISVDKLEFYQKKESAECLNSLSDYLCLFGWPQECPPERTAKNTFRGMNAHRRQEDVKVHLPEFEGLPLRGEGLELRMLRDAFGGSSQDKDSKWLL